MHAPDVIRLRYWTLKRLTILVGFILTVLGSVGAYLYVTPVEKRAADLADRIKSAEANIEVLKNADTSYWMFQQQGSLIFAIYSANTRDEAKGIIGDLLKLAVSDRTFPVRTVIGQLALANQLNYRETSDRYQKLVEQAAKEFTYPNFMAVNAFEKGFIEQAETMTGQLQQQRLTLQGAKGSADAELERHKLVLLILVTLGSTFLLAANLISTRDQEA